MITRQVQDASILIIDDEEMNIELMNAYLADDGYEHLTSTRDPRQALTLFQTVRPDLVLLDLHMPHLNGFAVLEQITAAIPEDDYLPIVVLTADANPEAKQRALAGGVHDFLTKPLDPVEVQLRIRNLLETRFLYVQQQAARAAAEASERRASFLAEASRVLGASFDYHTTLSSLARLSVPDWADYCAVDVLEGETGFMRVGAAHRDPAKEPLLREVTHFTSAMIPPEHPVMQVLSTGLPILVPEITPVMAEMATGDDTHRKIVDQLAPHAMISVPLITSGRVLGVLSLVTAESQRRYIYEDLVLAQELARRAALAVENARLFHEAQQATRARDDSLAVVAHDLRNPLNTIQLATGVVLEQLPDGPQKNQLNMIGRSAERMNRLIQDLLEVTRIESGKLSLDLRDESVGTLLKEATAMLQPLAAARSITFWCEFDENLPRVRIDVSRILQVLSNLGGNAIKFTPEGGRIRIICETVGEEVRFAMEDNGPGISAEQIPHIFGRFWQARGTDRRGIGLGLSIAHGIIEAHGGRIWVESRLGEGSTFYFTVPRVQSTGGPEAAPIAASSGAGGRRSLVG
jgi:signal transduction histidine kinase/CheY-like chemotaxis protein